MRPDQTKYILDNLNKQSVKEMANALGLKEKDIRRFIEIKKYRKKNLKGETKEEPVLPVSSTPAWVAVLSLVLIAILGFAAYFNMLHNDLLWDDEILITNNAYMKDTHNIPEFFVKNITYRTTDKSNFYRPIQMVIYAVTHIAWKLNPVGYHLDSILAHILTAFLVYWLVQILCRNAFMSIAAGLLFVLNPMHTEAVTYVSGIADPLAMFFSLLLVIFYVKCHSGKAGALFYILSIFAYIGGLLCKEIMVIIPLILVAYDYVYKRKFYFVKYIPFLALAVVYIILRRTVLDFPVKNTIATSTFFIRFPAIFGSLSMYIRKLLFPFDLRMEYELNIPSIYDIRVIAGIVIGIFLAFAAIFYRNKEKVITFALLWFLINYIPVSNAYPLNAFFSEHWIYGPSIGLFIIAAFFLTRLYERRGFFKALACGILVFFILYNSYFVIRQNRFWRTPRDVYERVLKYNTTSARVYSNLSLIYFKNGDLDKGIEYAKIAVKIQPDYADPHQNLANVYMTKGLDDLAIEEAQKALQFNPASWGTHNILGTLYYKKGMHDKAMAEFEKSVSLNPSIADSYSNLGAIYTMKGRNDEAIKALEKAVALNPDMAMAYNNVGVAYLNTARRDDAIKAYQKAVKLNPNYAEAYGNLSRVYYENKQYDLAVECSDKAAKLGFKANGDFLKLLDPYRKR